MVRDGILNGRLVMAVLLASVLSSMVAATAWGQRPMTPQERMAFWSSTEDKLLNARSTALRQERDTDDPLWIVDKSGVVHVVSGASLRERIVALAAMGQMTGVESVLIGKLPLWAQAGALVVGDEGRAEIFADRVMARYREASANNRRLALAQVERRLEEARAAFFRAKAQRDHSAGGSGVTVNVSKLALSGARICSSANLKSGRHWVYYNSANTRAKGEFYEHGGFLCKSDGKRFYRMGNPMLAFQCRANWQGCDRKRHLDFKEKGPSKDGNWNGKTYTSLFADWVNSSSSDWILLKE